MIKNRSIIGCRAIDHTNFCYGYANNVNPPSFRLWDELIVYTYVSLPFLVSIYSESQVNNDVAKGLLPLVTTMNLCLERVFPSEEVSKVSCSPTPGDVCGDVDFSLPYCLPPSLFLSLLRRPILSICRILSTVSRHWCRRPCGTSTWTRFRWRRWTR